MLRFLFLFSFLILFFSSSSQKFVSYIDKQHATWAAGELYAIVLANCKDINLCIFHFISIVIDDELLTSWGVPGYSYNTYTTNHPYNYLNFAFWTVNLGNLSMYPLKNGSKKNLKNNHKIFHKENHEKLYS